MNKFLSQKLLSCAVICLAAGLIAPLSSHAQNLLLNGSFESGPALNNGTYGRGQLPDGWGSEPGIQVPDILSNAYTQTGAGFMQLLNAQDGNRYLDMNGASSTGALHQDVTGLAPGSSLLLSFWSSSWAQNSSGALTISLVDPQTSALLAQRVVTYPYSPGVTSSQWNQYTLNGVVGASGQIRVLFYGDSGSVARGAPGLDNVTLTAAIPEPGVWTLLTGVVAAAGVRQLSRWRYNDRFARG